jgi:exodeoxyribonuclease VII large subunit
MSDMQSNIVEYSVSEISFAVKRSIEEGFSHVRVRGELGRISRPGSGHVYLDLKDDKAVLAGVIWRGTASRLKFKPEQGLEVIATGKLTTFPGQSKYQIVIEQLEPAGAGALMALLEERRRKLAAEGLFDEERKKTLPYLPRVIGVVTSPSGAVIRDILHRLHDRFPVHVLVWPVRVQGEGSAEEVTAAIEGFNTLTPDGPIPRPDLLIVARGGGSIEDLWSFNEENVVRAAAASQIPLISAIGHETDWTLIDHAADRRAPTPTGAAEMAVPVRAELVASVGDLDNRRGLAWARLIESRRREVTALARAIPSLGDLLAGPRQTLDNLALRLQGSLTTLARIKRRDLGAVAGRMTPHLLARNAQAMGEQVAMLAYRMDRAVLAAQTMAKRGLTQAAARLTPELAARIMAQKRDRLAQLSRLLSSLSYQSVLERGFALIRDAENRPVRAAAAIAPGDLLSLQFADGTVAATAGEGAPAPKPRPISRKAPARSKAKAEPAKDPEGQGDLF